MKTTQNKVDLANLRAAYEAAHADHVTASLDDFATPCPERVSAASAAKDAAWRAYEAGRLALCRW